MATMAGFTIYPHIFYDFYVYRYKVNVEIRPETDSKTSRVPREGRIQSWMYSLYSLFHVKRFLALLLSIGHIAVWGMVPCPPGFTPFLGERFGAVLTKKNQHSHLFHC